MIPNNQCFSWLYLPSLSAIVTIAVVCPINTSFALDVSTVIVNISLLSTIISSGTVMLRHTKLLTAVVEGMIRISFAKGMKSLGPEIEKTY